jgi:hypothetical protein
MPDRRFSGLDEDEFEQVKKALFEWAETHPDKDQPIIFMMGERYSARRFAGEVADRSEFGVSFLTFLVEQSRQSQEPVRAFINRAIIANGER